MPGPPGKAGPPGPPGKMPPELQERLEQLAAKAKALGGAKNGAVGTPGKNGPPGPPGPDRVRWETVEVDSPDDPRLKLWERQEVERQIKEAQRHAFEKFARVRSLTDVVRYPSLPKLPGNFTPWANKTGGAAESTTRAASTTADDVTKKSSSNSSAAGASSGGAPSAEGTGALAGAAAGVAATAPAAAAAALAEPPKVAILLQMERNSKRSYFPSEDHDQEFGNDLSIRTDLKTTVRGFMSFLQRRLQRELLAKSVPPRLISTSNENSNLFC